MNSNIDLNNKTLDCLKAINNIGSTTYKNVCSGAVSTVPWGSNDWLEHSIVGLLIGICLLIFVVVFILIIVEILKTIYENKDTTKQMEERIHILLLELIDKIGKQVTDDYDSKFGMWEGLSIKNATTMQIYIKIISSLFASEKKRLLEEIEEKVIGKDEVGTTIIDSPETEFLINKIPAIEGRNKFRAEQRAKLKTLK